MEKSQRSVLVCDFDNTLTAEDTTQLLLDAGGRSSSDVAQLFANYSASLKACLDEVHASKTSVPTERCHGYDTFQSHSRMSVVEGQFLKGIAADHFASLGQRVRWRPGALHTLRHTCLPVAIISTNFSGELIQAALRTNAPDLHVEIHSNHLEFEHGLSTGKLLSTVQTNSDKLGVLQSMAFDHTVYVGDSLGDLLPLLHASVGIMMGRDPHLTAVLGACQLVTQPLPSYSAATHRRGTILQTESWQEIDTFLKRFVPV
eukprot:NODE_3790_length_898_cov_25.072633_g3637_i0.p1 GENE.NODE_3790_length_898_cov_25.072633_g3637_i0~~NODE_3790_length_898_cov_25.072633_g3637_i0.p1  ORF type:complete len:269 (+),score=83.26 NODE_3790_length_898_cov_25.072633_g3637_i0:32-808(+)